MKDLSHSAAPEGARSASIVLRLEIQEEIDWVPDHLTVSAWLEHVPFAFWITKVLRPSSFVELGTHSGVSYAAFCQAVQRLVLGTRCYAVDTWAGDPQAGAYGEEVYACVSALNDKRYRAFSTLMRMTFDEARDRFGKGEIDLLHIDGYHTYEAVSGDFRTWRDALSDRAVVLFHDTNVRDGDFGVWRLWQELKAGYPHFEFLHGHGLGVLGLGKELPDPLKALLAATADPEAAARIRDIFASRGEAVHSRQLYQQTQALLAAATAELERLRPFEAEAARLRPFEAEAARLRPFEAEAIRLRSVEQALTATQQGLNKAAEDVAGAEARVRAAEAAAEKTQRKLQAIESSRIWRSTRPYRIAMDFLRVHLGGPSGHSPNHPPQAGSTVSRRITRPIRVLLRLARRDPAAWSQVHAMVAGRLFSSRFPTAAVHVPNDPTRPASPRVTFISGEPDTPGHIYRVVRYAEAARAAGAAVSILRIDEIPTQLAKVAEAAILVIWRAVWDARVEIAVGTARRAGARIVFDVDDLMVDPDLARVTVIDGIRSQLLAEDAVRDFYARIRRTMLCADLCTTTTNELAWHIRKAPRPALVLPNGFDDDTFKASRISARRWATERHDELRRIGYAGGSRTHQKDFALCAGAVARVLREQPDYRLVLFRSAAGNMPLLDIAEFPELAELEGQIEWRSLVPLALLPDEIARFDVNLAPLEIGNPFCEAKSELKFFEAALAGVCTVASPTGPFRRAIRDGETGLLADGEEAWYASLSLLLDDPNTRRRMAAAALRDVLWAFGPLRRVELMASTLDQLRGGRFAARAFALELGRDVIPVAASPTTLPSTETVFESDKLLPSDVTVGIPLHNYAHFVIEALDSVRSQTLQDLDLIVVDDASADDSLAVAVEWAKRNAMRFNRLLVLRNLSNAGLGPTRNVCFETADTPYVLPLDADNRLLPRCAEVCLEKIRATRAAYAYPPIRIFGTRNGLLGDIPFDPARFVGGNYIDAMALVAKDAWAAVGGYDDVHFGWEDFDFWCRFAERGLAGQQVGGVPLAEYRVHGGSMLHTKTEIEENKRRLVHDIQGRHPWLSITDVRSAGGLPMHNSGTAATPEEPADRLRRLLPLLRCPETGAPLDLAEDGCVLSTPDNSRHWPLVAGRPMLFPGLNQPELRPETHISNPLPESVASRIASTKGLVLNLSAGGTKERFQNVVEAEAAIFRHTDVVADAHRLPFVNESFEGVVALNAFEHYSDPSRAAGEIWRVLKPGGWVLIQTAFLQPQHEAPWHFYNCTKHGLLRWFEGFETEQLHVSENFNPSYAIAWIASECEVALRRDVSTTSAEVFSSAPIGRLVACWRDPATRTDPVWKAFKDLSQEAQEGIAAGFEYVGRKPAAA